MSNSLYATTIVTKDLSEIRLLKLKMKLFVPFILFSWYLRERKENVLKAFVDSEPILVPRKVVVGAYLDSLVCLPLVVCLFRVLGAGLRLVDDILKEVSISRMAKARDSR